MALEWLNGYVQDCSISRALAMEILQSYTKPSMYQCNTTPQFKAINVSLKNDLYAYSNELICNAH